MVAVMATSVGCTASSHAARPAAIGVASSGAAMEALIDRPGPVEVETVVGADWAVNRYMHQIRAAPQCHRAP
jgi:N-acyl homoserine lactone hydrolase